jgi:hypothetical protein
MHTLALAGTMPDAPSDALVAALLPPVLHSPSLLMAIALAILSSVVFSVLASSRCAFGRRRGPFVGTAVGVLGAILFFLAVRWEERARAWTRARALTAAVVTAERRVRVVQPADAAESPVVVLTSYGAIAGEDAEVRLSWGEAMRAAAALRADGTDATLVPARGTPVLLSARAAR